MNNKNLDIIYNINGSKIKFVILSPQVISNIFMSIELKTKIFSKILVKNVLPVRNKSRMLAIYWLL